MTARNVLLCVATVLVAGGCHRAAGGESGVMTRAVPEASAGPAQAVERQIVRRGKQRLGVDDVPTARTQVERVAASLEAQVMLADVRESEANWVFRVASPSLEPMMDSLAQVGRVDERTVSAQDVTEGVIDSEARLTALRATRDRLRQLLERAGSVQDVMAVERELARVQGDVESLEARLAALRSQVALSELRLQVNRRVVLGPLSVLAKGVGAVVGKLFVWR